MNQPRKGHIEKPSASARPEERRAYDEWWRRQLSDMDRVQAENRERIRARLRAA